MAEKSTRGDISMIVFLLLLNCQFVQARNGALPWDGKHISIVRNRTDLLKNHYIRYISQRTMKRNLYSREINYMFVDRLTGFLSKKVHKIENIRTQVKKLDLVYKYDDEIKPFNYYHRRNKPSNPVGIHVRFSTQVPVNLTRSHVQVPTEIYKNHVHVLNNARMSELLDDTFLRNFQKDNSLLWQYFCSEAGVHRVYPGEK